MIKTSEEDIRILLDNLGVKNNDIVMIHSALYTLGHIENGADGFYRTLRKQIGKDGTIIVPTFTYSFRRNQIFDVRRTKVPNEIGVFSEFVRNRENVVRSPDPLFSMAAEGPKAEGLMKRESICSFGENSIYKKIFQENILIIGFGISYSTGFAAFMHLEKLAAVDYRYNLELKGVSIDENGNKYNDKAIHFARNEELYPNGKTNREPIGHAMEKAGISRCINYGSGKHIAIRTNSFEDFVLNKLSKKPHVMFEPN
jgi:aminoglycoside 3-N-acetyltransferase